MRVAVFTLIAIGLKICSVCFKIYFLSFLSLEEGATPLRCLSEDYPFDFIKCFHKASVGLSLLQSQFFKSWQNMA